MLKWNSQIATLTCATAILCGGYWAALESAAPPSSGLVGVVRSADGAPMEGVAVSAKAANSTITTSVWTDR